MRAILSLRRTVPLLLAIAMLSPVIAEAKRPAPPSPPASSPAAADAVDRLGLQGPIAFDGKAFALAWSSHPSPTLYKQEYVVAGDSVERYAAMLMVDLRLDGPDAEAMARSVTAQVEARKATDPVANYDILTNPATGEVIIDFLMSAAGADGQLIVEWTAQRYANRPDGAGTTLVAFSRRGYGDGARDFLVGLKASRGRDLQALSSLSLAPVPAGK